MKKSDVYIDVKGEKLKCPHCGNVFYELDRHSACGLATCRYCLGQVDVEKYKIKGNNSRKEILGFFITWIIAYLVGYFILDVGIWEIFILGLIFGILLLFFSGYFNSGEVYD